MGSGSSPGGQPTPGKPIGLGGGTPALSGLVGQPKRALCALEEKSKRKNIQKCVYTTFIKGI